MHGEALGGLAIENGPPTRVRPGVRVQPLGLGDGAIAARVVGGRLVTKHPVAVPECGVVGVVGAKQGVVKCILFANVPLFE